MVELIVAGEIHPMRAETPCGAKRHGRMHPVAPGKVVGGGHHPTFASAHDDRLATQRGVLVLLDGGEEGVEIQMGDHPVGCPRADDDLMCLHVSRINERLFARKGLNRQSIRPASSS